MFVGRFYISIFFYLYLCLFIYLFTYHFPSRVCGKGGGGKGGRHKEIDALICVFKNFFVCICISVCLLISLCPCLWKRGERTKGKRKERRRNRGCKRRRRRRRDYVMKSSYINSLFLSFSLPPPLLSLFYLSLLPLSPPFYLRWDLTSHIPDST